MSKKMAVLMALQRSNRPMALNELLQILGTKFTERTTHRWLNDWKPGCY